MFLQTAIIQLHFEKVRGDQSKQLEGFTGIRLQGERSIYFLEPFQKEHEYPLCTKTGEGQSEGQG